MATRHILQWAMPKVDIDRAARQNVPTVLIEWFRDFGSYPISGGIECTETARVGKVVQPTMRTHGTHLKGRISIRAKEHFLLGKWD